MKKIVLFFTLLLMLVPCEVMAKVRIADIEYETLDEAVQNVKEGEVITLLDDVDVTDKKYGAYYNWLFPDNTTLDLNGHTIITGWNEGYPSSVWLGNNLTIKNGSFKSYYKDTEDGPYLVANYALFLGDIVETSNITLENIDVNTGINIFNTLNVTLKNVTAVGKKYYAVWLDEHVTATILSGEFRSDGVAVVGITKNEEFNSELIIEGGTFVGEKDKLSLSEQNADYLPPIIKGGTYDFDISEFVGEGYEVKKNGTKYVVDLIKQPTKPSRPSTSYDLDVVVEDKTKDEIINIDYDKISSILKEEVHNLDNGISERDIKVVLDVKDTNASETLVKEILKNNNVVINNFFDIKINIIDKYTNDIIGNLTELKNKIPISITIPEELITDKERKYYIFHEHEGEIEVIEPILSKDKKTLYFWTDSFSVYALGYEEMDDPDKLVNPSTEDEVLSDIVAMISSLLGGIISLIYLKKY